MWNQMEAFVKQRCFRSHWIRSTLNGFVFLLKSKCSWLAMAIEKDCLHNGIKFKRTSLKLKISSPKYELRLKESFFQKIANICKHFTAPEHFSVHRDSKMFAKYGDPTNNIISSEKNLPLPAFQNLELSMILILTDAPCRRVATQYGICWLKR